MLLQLNKQHRKAFVTFDLVIAFALVSLLFVGFNEIQKTQKIKQTHISEVNMLQSLDLGITASFEDILKTYADRLATITDADTKWGWNKLNTISPFPITQTVGGTNYLVYNLSSTGIGANSLTALKSRITSRFEGACEDWTSKVSAVTPNVYLYCEDVTRVRYNLSGGATNLTRPNALGAPIDSTQVPTAMITFVKRNGAGKVIVSGGVTMTQIYTSSFSEIYDKLRVSSENKLNTMRSAIENFTNATKLKEIANTENPDQSGGLNSADDEFIGWHWKIFGNNLANIMSTYCNKAVGGGTCSNLNTSNIWRSGANIRRGLISRRFVNNLLSGDKTYFLDGFNNGIYIYPTALQCTGSDYMVCNISALSLPADNYINKASPNTPPYTTVFYTEPFKKKSTAGKPYGRALVTY